MEPLHIKGSIITYSQEEHDGKMMDIIHHPGAVCVACQQKDGSYLMVKQYRYGIHQELIEFPAGKIDPNESPETSAKRELREETGYTANTWHYFGKMYPSPAILSEVIHLYLAKDLTFVGQDLDEDETLICESMSAQEIEEAILSNQIQDAKTIVLWHYIRDFLNQ